MHDMKHKVMVCVTRQKTCERLIRTGASMAKRLGWELVVVHVVHSTECIMGNPDESEALEYLFSTAAEYGAQMCMTRSKDPIAALAKCADDNDASVIIMGSSPVSADSIIDKLKARLNGVSFVVVEAEDSIYMTA